MTKKECDEMDKEEFGADAMMEKMDDGDMMMAEGEMMMGDAPPEEM